ncbi:MAG: Holliday junction branch migration protein RuvA [Tannerellaceae bacterium]|jgi:Holliday junction DNA helicase RuvA|nr:Holliday junction branch migration protein RuvA [Tannerellaceae bacterium]
MIEYVKGEVAELRPTHVTVECGGVGYGLHISLNTFSALNGMGRCKLFVFEVIREDAHILYGFASKDERELFLLLTSVSGVGPNTARMILSSYPPSELENIIAGGSEASLTAVKGIGLKTAQRILVDLKGKVKAGGGGGGGALVGNAGVIEEAVAALVMLGFQKAASQKVVITILKGSPIMPVEQVIKGALRML